MKTYRISLFAFAICSVLFFASCNEAEDNVINQSTCVDGEQNGDETGVDCGGSCEPCNTGDIDFSGTYLLEDSLGRPAVNVIFSRTTNDKNLFNTTPVSERDQLQENQVQTFQESFQESLEFYHDTYAQALKLEPTDIDYETNILSLNAEDYTRFLANFDALQVAPDGETVYYNQNTGLAFTGRNLDEDAIDITLTLMFGGTTGTRFDGNNDTPQLTSDGVGFGDRVIGSFPYLENALIVE